MPSADPDADFTNGGKHADKTSIIYQRVQSADLGIYSATVARASPCRRHHKNHFMQVLDIRPKSLPTRRIRYEHARPFEGFCAANAVREPMEHMGENSLWKRCRPVGSYPPIRTVRNGSLNGVGAGNRWMQ